MPTEDEYNSAAVYRDEGSETSVDPGAAGGWLGALADAAASEEGQAILGPIADGSYRRSLTFPATRPPWGGGGVDAENRQKFLDKAANGKGGLAPSAERLGAWYYLQNPSSPDDAWADASAYLPSSPWWPSSKAVDAVVYDLFRFDGYAGGRDTYPSEVSAELPRTGGSSMQRPQGAGVGIINPDFVVRPVGQAGQNGSTTGVLGGGGSPQQGDGSSNAALYVGGGAAAAVCLALYLATRSK